MEENLDGWLHGMFFNQDTKFELFFVRHRVGFCDTAERERATPLSISERQKQQLTPHPACWPPSPLARGEGTLTMLLKPRRQILNGVAKRGLLDTSEY